ncbi:MAG TPA: glutamate racemase [Rhabdochlamydiaceae bacterium]|nr:glutamate racemase [Rhabdochlamydiaceae bacterium]
MTNNSTDNRCSSIGIFDSGFGGLTVMKAIKTVMPTENIIYFGDTARLPYGNKSPDAILRYSIENATFLMEQKIKVLVIACNTACAIALEILQKMFDFPIVGVILPGVEEALQISKTNSIAILGTRATISSGVHQHNFQLRLPNVDLTPIACPLFVPLVEEGYIEHPMTESVAQEYLRPLRRKEVDTVLLACTHYPLLRSIIQKELGQNVSLVDPAMSCAETVRDLLISKNLENHQKEMPHYQFFVSDDPEKFRLLGKTFLNYPLEHVLSRPI